MENEGTFIWETGHSLTSDVAAYWKSGQPNGQEKENCVVMNKGKMYDARCSLTMGFVCQKRISDRLNGK